MLTIAPIRFTPAELERMSPSDTRWALEHLPYWLCRVDELALAGDDQAAWQLRCAFASIAGRIRRGGEASGPWWARQAAKLKAAMCGGQA